MSKAKRMMASAEEMKVLKQAAEDAKKMTELLETAAGTDDLELKAYNEAIDRVSELFLEIALALDLEFDTEGDGSSDDEAGDGEGGSDEDDEEEES